MFFIKISLIQKVINKYFNKKIFENSYLKENLIDEKKIFFRHGN